MRDRLHLGFVFLPDVIVRGIGNSAMILGVLRIDDVFGDAPAFQDDLAGKIVALRPGIDLPELVGFRIFQVLLEQGSQRIAFRG